MGSKDKKDKKDDKKKDKKKDKEHKKDKKKDKSNDKEINVDEKINVDDHYFSKHQLFRLWLTDHAKKYGSYEQKSQLFIL